jgi:proline dehydrogenase
MRRTFERSSLTARVVRRFVAGSGTDDAIAVTSDLAGRGLAVSLDHLGEDTTDADRAKAATAAYVELLERLTDTGLAARAEVSVKLSALGQALDRSMALDHAREICAAAVAAATTMTVDMEDHTTTDATLEAVSDLRADFPWVGAVLQAYLRRTEADCRDLATSGSRVRLCKGAYDEPDSVAFTRRADVDSSFRRCLQVLVEGAGYPMIATHDPALIEVAGSLVRSSGRASDSYEFQMLFGVRPDEQARLVASGCGVRVYVPYGHDWYGYFMRRLAERPANVGFFLRAMSSRH